MEKSKYVNNIKIIVLEMLAFIFLPITIGIVFLCLKSFNYSFVCMGIALFWSILFIVFRRELFKKLEITEQGFFVYYKNKSICELKFSDIVEVLVVSSREILFSKLSIDVAKKKWKDWKAVVSIDVYSDFFNEFLKYKDNLKVKIKNVEKLNKDILDKLK